MRLALSGFGGPLAPLVITYTSGGIFTPADYLALGYKNYDVMCVGAAGGSGGGMVPLTPYPAGNWLMKGGGGGGGGGLQRSKGLLIGLPASVVVVVGVAGAYGRNSDVPGSLVDSLGRPITDGADGGASSFNGSTCRASGGKGGKGVTNANPTGVSGALGGAGGIGGTTTAGGGASGGAPGDPNNGSPTSLSTGGNRGTWDGSIGSGGGGGGGGVARHDTGNFFTYWDVASQGGHGSYTDTDTTVFGQGGYGSPIVAGAGGGAKTTPLDHLLKTYGSYSDADAAIRQNGVVVVSLTP